MQRFFRAGNHQHLLIRGNVAVPGDDEFVPGIKSAQDVNASPFHEPKCDKTALRLVAFDHVDRLAFLQRYHRTKRNHDHVIEKPAGQVRADDLAASQQTIRILNQYLHTGRVRFFVSKFADELNLTFDLPVNKRIDHHLHLIAHIDVVDVFLRDVNCDFCDAHVHDFRNGRTGLNKLSNFHREPVEYPTDRGLYCSTLQSILSGHKRCGADVLAGPGLIQLAGRGDVPALEFESATVFAPIVIRLRLGAVIFRLKQIGVQLDQRIALSNGLALINRRAYLESPTQPGHW